MKFIMIFAGMLITNIHKLGQAGDVTAAAKMRIMTYARHTHTHTSALSCVCLSVCVCV